MLAGRAPSIVRETLDVTTSRQIRIGRQPTRQFIWLRPVFVRRRDCRSTLLCQKPFVLGDAKSLSGAPYRVLAGRASSFVRETLDVIASRQIRIGRQPTRHLGSIQSL